MAEIDNPLLQQLFDEVKAGYAMPIQLQISDDKAGVLRHDQSRELLSEDGALRIEILDSTALDYTLSHELLHMYFATKGFPQLQFHVLSGTPDLDRQYYAVATSLFRAVLHVQVVAWQREHDLITDQVEALITAGFQADVPAESADTPQLLVYRMVSLLDQLVFFGGGSDAQQASWQAAFPEAYPLAVELYQGLTAKPVDTPFALRRAVVKLFGQFDALVAVHGYQPVPLDEFATLPPVLSARQLRLSLNQLFELKHSEYRDMETKDQAYIALGSSDGQNAFVLPLTNPQPAFFQGLYQQPLAEVFKQYHIDYTVRE